MIRPLALVCVGALTVYGAVPGHAADAPVSTRVEARSADLLAVGLAHGDRMTIHVSRPIDNAPVRDAVVTVTLRGSSHATVAQADGSYTLDDKDITLPGQAAVEFEITEAGRRQTLKGTLQVDGGHARKDDQSNARQLWWWVLNFGVCIGFLWLVSRRKKSASN